MVQHGKKLAALVLAAAVAAGALAGCSGGGETSQASSAEAGQTSSQASSPSSQTSSDTEIPEEVDYSAGLTETGSFEGVKALELVTLPDYKTHEVPEDVSTVSDEDVQMELDNRMSAFATTEQIKDRAVEDGDTVNIDYVGSVDGVEFEGGNTGGNGTTVTIGVTSYIDDFLEQLIGHKPGDTFDVNVTFPTPYENNEDLSGKDAVFVTTINYIEEENTPELTDSFVKEHWKESEGWSTVAETTEGVREELRDAAVQQYLFDWVCNNAQISQVPDNLYQYQVNIMTGYYQNMAKQYGMTMDDLLKAMGVEGGADGLEESNKEVLEKNARESLILQALSEEMSVVPTDENIAAYMQRTAGIEDYSAVEEQYGKPYLMLITREDMAKRALSARP